MPDPVQLQFDGRLTNIAVQYKSDDFIADLVLPPSPVDNKKFTYKVYDKDSRFTLPNDTAGPKSESNEVEWKTTDATGTCVDRSLQEYVSNEEIDNAENPITPLADTTEFVTNLLMRAKEKRVADAIFSAANYATANKIDIAGAWATLSTDVLTQLEAGYDACFLRPNVLVMGLPTWRKVARNEKVLAAVWGTLAPQNMGKGKPMLKQAELAEYFGLDAVLVGWEKYNSAKEGQTASYAPIWDGTVATKGGAAFLRTKGAGTKDVVQLKNFTWKSAQVFSNPSTRGAFGGQIIKVSFSDIVASVATDVGYLFQDCLLT